METKQFQLGDVVSLKSGGPHMTINSNNAGGSFHCIWIAENKVFGDNFYSYVLKHVTYSKNVTVLPQ